MLRFGCWFGGLGWFLLFVCFVCLIVLVRVVVWWMVLVVGLFVWCFCFCCWGVWYLVWFGLLKLWLCFVVLLGWFVFVVLWYWFGVCWVFVVGCRYVVCVVWWSIVVLIVDGVWLGVIVLGKVLLVGGMCWVRVVLGGFVLVVCVSGLLVVRFLFGFWGVCGIVLLFLF